MAALFAGLACTVHADTTASATPADQARMEVVTAFADNVLRDAADRYRAQPTPLLANIINVRTREAFRWTYPDKRQAVFSDFALQQNLMRTLVALSRLTGNAKYEAAARAECAYMFAHEQLPNGLLVWGGHRYIDLLTLEQRGVSETEPSPHELKNAFPYYEFMYEVNPAATARFIRAFWGAHVYNWRTLEVSRHGDFAGGGAAEAAWGARFEDPAPYFETKGLSFLDAGNDLIYSGAMLYKLAGDEKALQWVRRLEHMYVKARNPDTGLGAYQYTQPRKTGEAPDDRHTFSNFGDRAKRQFGPDFPGHLVLEATMLVRRLAMTIYSTNALMQLQVGSTLGSDGAQLVNDTHSGLIAFERHALVPGTCLLKPMLTDGTDLSGFVAKRDGYYMPKGTVIERYPATPELMIAYARAFLVTHDPELWTMARAIAKDAGLGDIGATPGKEVRVNLATRCSDTYALFSMLDLYQETHLPDYLALARVIGDNLVKARWHHGYFTERADQLYANIDAIEPLALLALEATIRGEPAKVPYFINGSGFFSGDYLFPDGTWRQANYDFIFRIRDESLR